MISSVTYTGDGATRVFPVAFEIQGENYVVVFINDVAISDRTTYDIINNSIVFVEDSIPEASSNIEIVVASSPTELGDLDAPPSITQTVLDNLDNINIIANNIDLIRSAVDTGGTGIAVVGTLPITADIGTVVYLAPESALYVYDGTIWQVVGQNNEAELPNWTTWALVPNISEWYASAGGQSHITDNDTLAPTILVDDNINNVQTDLDTIVARTNDKIGTKYTAVLINTMYLSFAGRVPESSGLAYWMKKAHDNVWSETDLAYAIYYGMQTYASTVQIDWTTFATIPNTSSYFPTEGGVVTLLTEAPATISVSESNYNNTDERAYVDAHLGDRFTDGAYTVAKIVAMYQQFFGRNPELKGLYNWLKIRIDNNWSETTLAQTLYSAGFAYLSQGGAAVDDWTTWATIPNNSTYVETEGGVVTAVNGVPPTITMGGSVYNNVLAQAYFTAQASTRFGDGDYVLYSIILMYQKFFGRNPEVNGLYFWSKMVIDNGWSEDITARNIYNAGLAYVQSSTTSNDVGGVIIGDLPAEPTQGTTVLNVIDGTVSIWDDANGGWETTEYVPATSATTRIQTVDALPSSGEAGQIVYNTSDDKMYVYLSGAWTPYFETIVPSMGGGVQIVASLPESATDGEVVFNSTDKKLYERVNGAWVNVVEPTTASATVADGSLTTAAFAAGLRPVEIVGVLPTTGNSIGRVVMLTTDGQLYRYTATGFTTAVPATGITGQITATQIANNSITTGMLQANSVTATNISAGAVTATALSANSVIAGKISAGAISATEIASNAITSSKIYAGAITTDKISANAVDATKITAGAITADKISANAITAGHISAGAITVDKIAAGSITADRIAANTITAANILAGTISADKIATNAITADKILAGAITATKLDVDALIGKRLQFDSTTASSTYNVTDAYFGTQTTAFSFLNTNKTYGICSVKSNSGGGSAIYALCSNTSQTGSAIVGVNASTSTSSWGSYIKANYGIGIYCESILNKAVVGETTRTDGQWGFYTSKKTYSGGGYSPFTGSHIVYTNETLKVGDLVYSDDAWVVDTDNTLVHVKKTTNAKDKRVIGVVSYVKTTLTDNITENLMISEQDSKGVWHVKPQFKEYVDYMVNSNFVEVEINSVGEGAILVCNANGNIDNGDYLTSSSLAGYAMKQDDDLLHNYTVAKALESVDWSKESATTKMIAVTYHAG